MSTISKGLEKQLELYRNECISKCRAYMNEFIRCRSSIDMLELGLFPNAKEISESFGMFNAVRKVLGAPSFADPKIAVYAIGDGSAPRTAATFAFRTNWQTFSVDPALTLKPKWRMIKRLVVLPQAVEHISIGCMPDLYPAFDSVVIAAVHSHADLTTSHSVVKARHPKAKIHTFAMPCCVNQALGARPPDEETRDMGIMSMHNLIKYWKPQ